MFEKAYKIVRGHEGGDSNRAADRGGLTSRGVTQKRYNKWRTNHGLPLKPVTTARPSEIQDIYKEGYWWRGRCDKMDWPLALVHFDGCVNHGPPRAGRLLQTAINAAKQNQPSVTILKVDGAVGPKTLSQLHNWDQAGIANALLWERLRFYSGIVGRDRTGLQIKNLRGWLNRAVKLKAEVFKVWIQ